MIKVSTFGPITRFDLARELVGRGRYWTIAYYLDGLLIDTGCAFTAGEMVNVLSDRPILHIVNTHSHEDHIGANGLIQRDRLNLDILAHLQAIPVLADPRSRQPFHLYRKVF